TGRMGEPRPMVLTEDRWTGRLSAADFPSPVAALDRVRVPKGFQARNPADRRDLAATLRQIDVPRRRGRRGGRTRDGDDDQLAALRAQLRRHPCHGCPDREEHARWAERRHRLDRDTQSLRDRVAHRTNSLARTFDQVCAVLSARGYLTAPAADAGADAAAAGAVVTDAGRMLARIWTESDLLVAECLGAGVWDGLAPAELAAAVSVLVYEARREAEDRVTLPRGPVADAVEATLRLYADLDAVESARGLDLTREPDLGFVWPMYRWARGEPLAKVLSSHADGDMPAGDFVRWARQVMDLLGQLADAPGPAPLREAAREAMTGVRRGVLAYSALS
ncbi:MAG TPA: RNA helicase, partial [Pilimelia sp.]|nr:RNA helicase [Pilimelia sp.]